MLIGSPHDTSAVSQAVRSYLNLEWQRKLDEKVGVSTPTVWAKEHADMSHLFNAETIPHIVGDVPSQDNGYDCGLFLLTYMDLWTYSPPDHVDMCKEVRLKGKHLCCYYAHTAVYICFVFQVLHMAASAQHARMHASATQYVSPGTLYIVIAAFADNRTNLMH